MKAKIKIVSGMRFKKLVAVKKVEKLKNDKDKHDKWLCQCDCGNTTIVRSSNLRGGLTKSCGCLLYEIKNMKGQRFGRLVALEHVGFASNRVALWRCKCDCGNEVVVRQCNLHSGNAESCGCFGIDRIKEANTTHGQSHTRIFNIWSKIKERCYNPKRPAYKNYGGKGVVMCDEWRYDFQMFYNWAMANGYQDDLTIDRIDANGNYEPLNCRWLTLSENVRMKNADSFITINGLSLTIHDWAIRINMIPDTLMSRYREFGVEYITKWIKHALTTGDNSFLYKRKEYANGQIKLK